MSSISLDDECIKKLINISKDAGNAIMEIYESDFDVNVKSDQTPLTKADILSNTIILDSLKEFTPNIPILSEESSNIPYDQRSKWRQYWLVDPLDGTKEFIKKNGEFTTNIALIYENRPIFGMIHAPAIDEFYWGSMEMGAFHLIGNKFSNRKKISVSQNKRGKLRIVSSRSHPSDDIRLLLKKLDIFELVGIGSSLKFCLIAKGEADCYPRLGPTCEWDTAAGEIIAESAGAIVVDTKNNQIQYNKASGFLNPSFIVALNRDLIKELVLMIDET